MKYGLQAIGNGTDDYDVYYFDESGFMKTGKVSNVELNDGETANFYFETSNSHKGRGVTGEENGYLYYKGMRLEAEDDYKIFGIPTDDNSYDYYLVNTNGKIQKGNGTNGKKIDPEKVENDDYEIVSKCGAAENDDINLYFFTDKNGKFNRDMIKYGENTKTAKKLNNWTDLAAKADVSDDVDFGWED